MHTDRAGRVDTLPISIHLKLEMMVLFPQVSPSFSLQALLFLLRPQIPVMFLLCTVSPTSPLQNLFYYYILVLSTLYIRHTPSIYPYYILDICIDIPSIFIPNTYSILNTSHTLTHPVKDAQSDKEKKNVIVLTPVYINILIPP